MAMQDRETEHEVYAVYARAVGGRVGVEEQARAAREAIARRATGSRGRVTTKE